MRARVPTSVVDNTYEAFPAGLYDGKIATAEIRDASKTKDGSWLTLKLGVEDITPRDGTPSPGREKFTGELTLTTDGVDVFTVEDFTNPNVPFGIRKTAGLLAGLAEGLNLGTRTKEGVEADLKQVAEALVAGDLKGDKISFEVAHYTNKTTGKIYDQYNRIGAAS